LRKKEDFVINLLYGGISGLLAVISGTILTGISTQPVNIGIISIELRELVVGPVIGVIFSLIIYLIFTKTNLELNFTRFVIFGCIFGGSIWIIETVGLQSSLLLSIDINTVLIFTIHLITGMVISISYYLLNQKGPLID